MEHLFLPGILVIAGAFFLYRNISCIRDEAKLRDYLENSPKAKLWVNKLGIEKTVYLSKKYLLPLGIVVATALLGCGLYGLILQVP